MSVRYYYGMFAIPSRDITPKQKQDAVIRALRDMTGKAIKQPADPKYSTDDFWCSEPMSSGFGFPIYWKIMGSMFEGIVNSSESRAPDAHYTCDDSLGALFIDLPNQDARVTPQWFSHVFVPTMADAFDAYRFELTPQALFREDKKTNPERMKMYRWDVVGVSTVSFYDDRLCASAFGLTAQDVSDRLSNVVPYTAMVKLRNRSGVVIQSVTEFTESDDVLKMRESVESALRTKQ